MNSATISGSSSLILNQRYLGLLSTAKTCHSKDQRTSIKSGDDFRLLTTDIEHCPDGCHASRVGGLAEVFRLVRGSGLGDDKQTVLKGGLRVQYPSLTARPAESGRRVARGETSELNTVSLGNTDETRLNPDSGFLNGCCKEIAQY